jgi:hypothetical protein
MRPADRRERAIAVHESAHMAQAFWNKIPCQGVRIKRKGDVTKGVGAIKLPPFPEGWRTDPDAQIDLKVLFYKYILIFSAGYLAEFMFSGEKDFWKSNPLLMEQTEKTDVQALWEVAATIPKKEFKGILHITHEHLAKPDNWGIILDIAKDLLKYKVITGFSGHLVHENSDPVEPEHDAGPLIKFMADGIYN